MTAAEIDALGEAFATPARAFGLLLEKQYPDSWVLDAEMGLRWPPGEWVYAYPGNGAARALEQALAVDGVIDDRFWVVRT